MQILDFFKTIFFEEKGFLEIRLLQTSKPPIQRFFKLPAGLMGASLFCSQVKDYNCYFGVLPREKESGKTEDIKYCGWLWADIDDRDTGSHEKSLQNMKTFPVVPTLIVDTGHGVHGYWKLKLAQLLTDHELANRIKSTMDAIAQALQGDKVSDFARILRVPGTWNVKDIANPVECKIIEQNSNSYDIDDFEKFVVITDSSYSHSSLSPVSGKPEQLESKLDCIVELASRLWVEGHRHNLCLYLSGWLAKEGFIRDEIIEIITKICAKANDTELSQRLKEAETTCNKILTLKYKKISGYMHFEQEIQAIANNQPEIRFAFEELKAILPKEPRANRKEEDIKITDRDLQKVQDMVKIAKIEKLESDNPVYKIYFENSAKIIEASFKQLKSWVAFSDLYTEKFNRFLLVVVKPKLWKSYLAKLFESMEIQDISKDMTYKYGVVWKELHDVLTRAKENINYEQLKRTGQAYLVENEIIFKGDFLRRKLTQQRIKISDNDFFKLIKSKGAKPKTLRYKDESGQWFSMKCWSLPIESLDGEAVPDQKKEEELQQEAI